MKNINELLKELCPNGVEFVSVKKIAEVGTGNSDRKDAVENGEFPFYVRSRDILKSNKYLFDETAIVIPGEGGVGDIFHYVEGKYDLHQRAYRIHFIDDAIEPKFEYYYFCNSFKAFIMKKSVEATVTSIRKPMIEEFQVPVPPLEVQREIVHILDEFTLLSAELSAELQARKKQYEYYRDSLLDFNVEVEKIPMGDLFEFRNGLSKGKEYFGKGIPFIRYTDVYNNRFLRKKDITALVECTDKEKENLRVKRGDVLFTRTSETAEDVGWSSVMLDDIGDCVFNGFTIKATPKTNKLLPEYCAYCFSTGSFRKYVTSRCAFTTRASLTGNTIAEYKLPVPPIEVQRRIAEVLDNFETICNDLSIGLPAEIEARQKQYEYYRDLLLTFAETGDSILTDRQTDRQSIIKLLQYVFGFAYVGLEDISENMDSMRKPVTKGKRIAGEYPYYGASGIVDYVEDFIFDGDYLLISEDGANLVARVTPIAFSITGKTWVNNHAHVLKFEDWHTQRYVEMYFNGMNLNKYISGAAQPKLNQKNLNSIRIPLPSKEEVARIVDLLERFDRLCNDISEGLPAEIDARQKQYEYYRDKLLNFKEKEANS